MVGQVSELNCSESQFNVSVSFPSKELAVVSDGCGGLCLFSREAAYWCVLWTQQVADVPFLVGASGAHADGRTVDCLLMSLVEGESGETRSITQSQISWIGIEMLDDSRCDFIRRCSFSTTSWPEMLTFDCDCSAVFILCNSSVTVLQSKHKTIECQHESKSLSQEDDMSVLFERVQFVHSAEDSLSTEKLRSESKATKEREIGDEKSDEKQYWWSQTDEDVIVSFSLPSDVTKKDIVCHININCLEFSLSNGECLINGQLFGDVYPDGSCWTMQQSRAEVSLEKKERGRFWPSLLAYKGVRQAKEDTMTEGDSQEWPVSSGAVGNKEFTDEEIQAIHKRLEKYTSDKLDDPGNDINVGQRLNEMMEECDIPLDDTAAIYRFNSKGVFTHRSSLGGHQWLFNVHIKHNHPQAVCLRHDVDGLLWQLGGNNTSTSKDKCTVNHVATFHALGYVQASKQQKKFTSCSNDLSFAVICDCMRYVYIYLQPDAVASSRNSGKSANQLVVTLPHGDILGMAAFPGLVYVLTSDAMFSVKI